MVPGAALMPTALIDGDIIAYQVAAMAAKPSTFEGTVADSFDEDEVRKTLGGTIEKWRKAADCTDAIVLVTGDLNFRKLVDPTYKGNRVGKEKPIALSFAKQCLRDDYGARMVEGLEADDLIGLMLTGSMADGAGVAVSIDKDLRTVPGLHCNPMKGGVRNVTEDYANKVWMTQVLTGDPTDGYKGAKGIGPGKAAKALTGRTSLHALWAAVCATYARVGMTAADATRNARLARILRTGDFNRDTREVRLWHPQTPEFLCLSRAFHDQPDQPETGSGPLYQTDQTPGVGSGGEPGPITEATGP